MNETDLDLDENLKENELNQWEEEDTIQTTSTPINYKENQLRVIRTNQDYNLDYLTQSLDKTIFLGPHYQRRSRWNINQKSLLIESFLLNIPIPPIFLFEKEFHFYEVVDGKQRLEAIKDFFTNSFKLRNLTYYNHLNGKKFEELTTEDQRLLMRRSISATILMAESKGFDEIDVRMLLFDRLNTGGVKLNSQELRNAIFSGSFNSLLDNLSKNGYFRLIWGIPNPIEDTEDFEKNKKALENNTIFKSMLDCELILRVFGINEVYNNNITEGSMKFILDSTMKKYQNIDEDDIELFGTKFEKAMEFIYQTFEKDSIKNPILKPAQRARNIYDALVVAYWNVDINDIVNKDTIQNNFIEIFNINDNYDKIITKGNSIENIKYRVEKFIEILTLK